MTDQREPIDGAAAAKTFENFLHIYWQWNIHERAIIRGGIDALVAMKLEYTDEAEEQAFSDAGEMPGDRRNVVVVDVPLPTVTEIVGSVEP